VAQLPKMKTLELHTLGVPMGIAIEMIAQAKGFLKQWVQPIGSRGAFDA
jgi:hypothetical protein